MFTIEDRAALRSSLLERAARDTRITGAAITGSGAESREDRWSDIDLAFGVSAAAQLPDVLADWTAPMCEEHGAVHHVDVLAGPWTYRVFFLANTLQVDLAFVTEAEFRALAPSFRLVSGKAAEPRTPPAASIEWIIGMAWLHALHARSSIARGKLWQAEYMISGMRDHALALACVRHGLPAVHARGIDQLPESVRAPFTASLVRHLDADELARAFRAVTLALLSEIESCDSRLATRLRDPLLRTLDSGDHKK